MAPLITKEILMLLTDEIKILQANIIAAEDNLAHCHEKDTEKHVYSLIIALLLLKNKLAQIEGEKKEVKSLEDQIFDLYRNRLFKLYKTYFHETIADLETCLKTDTMAKQEYCFSKYYFNKTNKFRFDINKLDNEKEILLKFNQMEIAFSHFEISSLLSREFRLKNGVMLEFLNVIYHYIIHHIEKLSTYEHKEAILKFLLKVINFWDKHSNDKMCILFYRANVYLELKKVTSVKQEKQEYSQHAYNDAEILFKENPQRNILIYAATCEALADLTDERATATKYYDIAIAVLEKYSNKTQIQTLLGYCYKGKATKLFKDNKSISEKELENIIDLLEKSINHLSTHDSKHVNHMLISVHLQFYIISLKSENKRKLSQKEFSLIELHLQTAIDLAEKNNELRKLAQAKCYLADFYVDYKVADKTRQLYQVSIEILLNLCKEKFTSARSLFFSQADNQKNNLDKVLVSYTQQLQQLNNTNITNINHLKSYKSLFNNIFQLLQKPFTAKNPAKKQTFIPADEDDDIDLNAPPSAKFIKN